MALKSVLLPEFWKTSTSLKSKVYDMSTILSTKVPLTVQIVNVPDTAMSVSVEVFRNILLKVTVSGGTFYRSPIYLRVYTDSAEVPVTLMIVNTDRTAGYVQPDTDLSLINIPPGGAPGQVLAKVTAANGDVAWVNVSETTTLAGALVTTQPLNDGDVLVFDGIEESWIPTRRLEKQTIDSGQY